MSATAATIVHDPSEAEPLCPALGLYLKPITKLAISVALPPPPRPPGKSVSNWEVMERLKAMAAGAGPEDGVTAGVTGLAVSGSFSSLRIAKSTPEFVRFEGEVEQRALVRPILARLDGRGLKLAGFPDALRVRAAELRPHAPARRDWDAAATDADADEARPGERPDTIHLEGLPCRWFAPRAGGRGEAASARDEAASASTSSRGEAASASTSSTSARSEATSFSTSTSTSSSTSARSEAASCGASASTSSTSARSEAASCGASASTPLSTSARSEAASSRAPASTPSSDRPSEALLRQAFSAFGEIRQVDIPMLDPYHEDAARGGGVIGVGGGVIGVGGGFHPFGWGGGLHFEAYVQYREHAGFARAMAALRGAKLMYKGDDGKAVACGIKVSFDATEHLSEASIRRRQLERQKLRELELQREEQKRREREEEERRRAEERKQKQLEQQQRARRREEKLRRREQRARAREQRRGRRRAERRRRAEEQRRLQARIRTEERKLLLAQRNLQSIRLVAELLGRVEAAKLQQRERSEERRRRQRQEERRRLQEAELRRVEEEKARALGLQRRERELRQRLLALLLSRRPGAGDATAATASNPDPGTDLDHDTPRGADDLLRPVLDILHRVTHARAPPPPPQQQDSNPDPKATTAAAATTTAPTQVLACIRENAPPKPGAAASPPPPPPPRDRGDHDKCNREPECERRSRSRGGERPWQHRARARVDVEDEEDGWRRRRRHDDKDGSRERKRERGRRRHGRHSRSGSRSPRRRGAWNR